jgi:hypothetical protein
MRIPTEAELIEMERAADALAVLAEEKLEKANAEMDRQGAWASGKVHRQVTRAKLEMLVAVGLTRLIELHRSIRRVA